MIKFYNSFEEALRQLQHLVMSPYISKLLDKSLFSEISNLNWQLSKLKPNSSSFLPKLVAFVKGLPYALLNSKTLGIIPQHIYQMHNSIIETIVEEHLITSICEISVINDFGLQSLQRDIAQVQQGVFEGRPTSLNRLGLVLKMVQADSNTCIDLFRQ